MQLKALIISFWWWSYHEITDRKIIISSIEIQLAQKLILACTNFYKFRYIFSQSAKVNTVELGTSQPK